MLQTIQPRISICMEKNLNMEPIDKANQIKMKHRAGILTYEQAKIELKPVLGEMNKLAEKIAKKYNRKHYNFSVTKFLR